DADTELRLREDTEQALGFAEDAPQFAAQGRVAMVIAGQGALSPTLRAVMNRLPVHCQAVDAGQVLGPSGVMPVPDLFIIDGATRGEAGEPGANDVLRLVADLHSRSGTRHAAQLVILPETAADTAAMAL